MARDTRSNSSARLRGSRSRPSSSRPGTPRPAKNSRARGGSTPSSGVGRATRARRSPRSMRRLTVLGALVVFLAVLITPTLRSYLHAQGEIDGLRTKVATQKADVASLKAQQKRWNDPMYVKEQAAKRLGFAAPGGTLTVLVDESGAPRRVSKTGVVVAAPPSATHPWYGQLWQSLVRAPTP